MTTKPAKRCRHLACYRRWLRDSAWHLWEADERFDWNTPGSIVCDDCGTWLPLGPAKDDDPRVEIEVRAAELTTDDAHVRRLITNGVPGRDDEVDGYLTYFSTSNYAPSRPAHEAGYLAAAILEHDPEAT